MSVRLLILLSTVLTSVAYSQPGGNGPAERSYFALYDSFFYRVVWLDDLADKFAARHKDDSAPRSLVRRETGLTVEEEAVLKKIAKTWKQIHNGAVASARETAVAPRTAATQVRLAAYQSEYEQQVIGCIAELRRYLGPAKFKLLDTHVRLRSTRGVAASAPTK